MGLRSTAAIVAYSLRMTGSSRLVTLVTERYGLVKLMAKGARRPKSRYGAAFEPLTSIDVIYWHKDGRDIQSLSDAEIVDDYAIIKADLRRMSFASCMVEIARAQTPGEDPTSEAYPLLVDSFESLSRCAKGDEDKQLWRFMLRFLETAGYRPDLEKCMVCGKSPRGKAAFFSYADGALICSCTDPGNMFGSRVSPGALMVMRELSAEDESGLSRLKIGRKQKTEVEDIILKFLAYHTGRTRTPKALEFLRKIENR